MTLLLLPFVLTHVSDTTYGEWATLSAVLAFAGLLEAGVPTEVSRRVALHSGRGDSDASGRAVREAITLMSSLAAALLIIGVALAFLALPAVFPGAAPSRLATLRLVFLSTVLLLAVTLVLSVWFAMLGGLQRQDYGTYSGLIGLVLGALVTAAGALAGFDIWALFTGALARSVLSWVGPVRGMRTLRPDVWPLPVSMPVGELRTLMSASSLLIFVTLANIADSQVDKIALSRYSGAAVAGYFQIGVTLALQARTLVMLPASPLLAGTAELHGNDSDKLERLLRLVRLSCTSAGVIALGGSAVFSAAFVQLWLGPEYEAAGRAASLLALGSLPPVLTIHWYFYALGRGWLDILAKAAAVSLFLNTVCTLALTPRFGLDGALLGSGIANVSTVPLMYFLLRGRDPIAWLAGLWRPVTAAIVVIPLASVLFGSPNTWLGFSFSILAYLCAATAMLAATGSLPIILNERRRVALRA